jgi:hypothetical protein
VFVSGIESTFATEEVFSRPTVFKDFILSHRIVGRLPDSVFPVNLSVQGLRSSWERSFAKFEVPQAHIGKSLSSFSIRLLLLLIVPGLS